MPFLLDGKIVNTSVFYGIVYNLHNIVTYIKNTYYFCETDAAQHRIKLNLTSIII